MILFELTHAIPTHKRLASGKAIAQPALQLFAMQRVSHAFEDTIKRSKVMQQRMWLSPPTNALHHLGTTPHFEPLIWLMSFLGLCHGVSQGPELIGSPDMLSTRTVHQHEYRAWPRAFKSDILGGPAVTWRQIPASLARQGGQIWVEFNLQASSRADWWLKSEYPQTRRYAELGRIEELDDRTLGELYDRLTTFMQRTPEQHDKCRDINYEKLEKLKRGLRACDRW